MNLCLNFFIADGPVQYQFSGSNDIHEQAIFSHPNSASVPAGWLRTGATFEVISKKKGWTQIRFDAVTGWIEEIENAEKFYDVAPPKSVEMKKSWYRVTYAVALAGHPVYSTYTESSDKLLGHLQSGVC
jgi:hypothetical protein